MNDAVKKSAAKVEETLRLSGDFRKIDNHLFVIRQGSAYVMISVAPWGEERALVRFVAQVIVGARLSPELAIDLLRRNASLRFGAFAFFQREQVIAITHTLLGGKTLDGDEILAAARDLAILADGVDEELMIAHGGRRMQDLIEEESIKSIAEELHTDSPAPAVKKPVPAAKPAPAAKKPASTKPAKKAAPAPKSAPAAKKEPAKKAAPAAKKEPAKKPAPAAKKPAPKSKK